MSTTSTVSKAAVITKGVLLVLIAVGSALQPAVDGKPLSQVDWPSMALAALLSGSVALKAYLDDSAHRMAQAASQVSSQGQQDQEEAS